MLFYPSKDIIQHWVSWVADQDYLRQYLPPLTEEWAAMIEADFQLTQMVQADLPASAARLFYRIIKNHRFIDGNKRSALLATYLFVAYNMSWLNLPPKFLYTLAKETARDTGKQEEVIADLADTFAAHLEPLVMEPDSNNV